MLRRTGRKKARGEAKNASQEPLRPALDLSRIKERYSAPQTGDAAGDQGAAEISFINAEDLPPEEKTAEDFPGDPAAEQIPQRDGSPDSEEGKNLFEAPGMEAAGGEGVISLFDEEDGGEEAPAGPKDRPAAKGKKRKKKKYKRKSKKQEDRQQEGPALMDFSKPRQEPRRKIRVSKDVFEKVVLLCGFLLMASILAGLYYWMQIDRIEVEGNTTLARADVLTQSGINVGEHILFVNTRAAEERLEENPIIRTANIRRLYPNRLVIQIEEREPLAAISGGGSYAIIDREGYVIAIQDTAEDLLQIYGMGATGFQLNQRIGEEDDFYSRTMLAVMEALENSGLIDDMSSLDITQPLSIDLLSKEGYTIHLGQVDNLESKLASLPAVLDALESMGYSGGTIDLAVQGDPVYSPPQSLTQSPEEGAEDTEQTEGAPEDTEAADAEAGDASQPAASPSPTPASRPEQPPATSTGEDNFDG